MVGLQYFWTYSKYAKKFLGGRISWKQGFPYQSCGVQVLYNSVNNFSFMFTNARIDNYVTNYQGASFIEPRHATSDACLLLLKYVIGRSLCFAGDPVYPDKEALLRDGRSDLGMPIRSIRLCPSKIVCSGT